MHKRLIQLLGRWPIAWIIPPIILVASLWNDNKDRVDYPDALQALGLLLVLVLIAFLLFRILLRSWRRASLATAFWTFFLVNGPTIAGSISSRAWLIWLILGLGAVICVDLTRRIPDEESALSQTSYYANIGLLGWGLIALSITLRWQIDLEDGRASAFANQPPFQANAESDGPDIWHIVFDRYGSRETLLRSYDYDNQAFLDALETRGFAVSDNAFANYQRTGHSLASTLNASYLDNAGRSVRSKRDWVPLYRGIRNNRAFNFFDKAGYNIRFAGSWWGPTLRSSVADQNVVFRAPPQLAAVLLGDSLPGKLLKEFDLPYGNERRDQCQRVSYKFASLGKAAAVNEKKFVFAHFLVPHPPYVLNADGSCRSLATASATTRAENYVAQLRYTNDQIIKLVDQIVAGPRPSVIVLHADEGPWPMPHVGDERFLGSDPVIVNWHEMTPTQTREKLGIMLAIRHVEGKGSSPLRSPINIYPMILEDYFDSAEPRLPEIAYLYQHRGALYSFKDVTEVFED